MLNKYLSIIFTCFISISCGIESTKDKQLNSTTLTPKNEINFEKIFNEWKTNAYSNGDYAKPEDCNLEYVIANENKSNVGIPNDDEIDQFI